MIPSCCIGKVRQYRDEAREEVRFSSLRLQPLAFRRHDDILRTKNILTLCLRRHLLEAFNKCSFCKQVGRPADSRKIIFVKLLSCFNGKVQMDFCYLTELAKYRILHMVDAATGFYSTLLSDSRLIPEEMKSFELV